VTGVVDVLSYPVRLLPSGRIATVEQDSTDHYRELLVALALTRLGERPLVPAFGIPDPAFEGIDLASVATGAAIFGPPVTIDDVTVTVESESVQSVTITFE